MLRYIDKIVTRARYFWQAPNSATVEMRGGYRLSLRPNTDRHERQLYFDRTYEPATLALFDAVLRPGDTMVDVGASLGLMTLHASKIVGNAGAILAMEPHPLVFARLVDHLRLNGCTNVTALQIAAGSVNGTKTIYDVPSVNIGRASLIVPKGHHVPAGDVTVAPLDDILRHQNTGPVRMLKIDVEGFESEVLRGATETLRQKPIICMEVSAALDFADEDALAAHDIIMTTGDYCAYRSKYGKSRSSPMVMVTDRSRLARQKHDNVIYIPIECRRTLPTDLLSA